jgi:HlyD family secretion protein
MLRLKQGLFGVAVVSAAAGVFFYNQWLQGDKLAEGFASGNGRIEATEVDVTSKLAGRLNDILVREGDMVTAGQPVATLDMRNLEAQRRAASAELARTGEAKAYAGAIVDQRRSELELARKRLVRTLQLQKQGHVSQEQVDTDRASQTSAEAALRAAEIGVRESAAAIDAAQAQVESIDASLADSQLSAPLSGRILYRLAEPGEVIAAGGKVLTLLDLEDVYMTIFLPTGAASLLSLNDEARVLLDAAPGYVFPATVSYVSPEAQFTPKMVETREEREKLMFRVKVRVDPAVLHTYQDRVKVGVPGEAFVRTHSGATWPAELQVKLP